jgi:hypothetical protein
LRQTFGMRDKIAEDTRQVRQDDIIPIADDDYAFFGEPLRAAVVSLFSLLGMLPTIDFDREAQARTIEVERKWPDRVLPSEMKTIELIAAKCVPQSIFSFGHVAAELSCSCGHCSGAGKA